MPENDLLRRLNSNREKIFAFVGVCAVVILILYIAYKLLELVATIPGFQFDPFTFGALVILSFLIYRFTRVQLTLTETLNQILNLLYEKWPLKPENIQTKITTIADSDSSENNVRKVRKPRRKTSPG